MKISKNQLKDVFEKSRCKESSTDPDNRSHTNRDRFQCTSTSFNIKDLFGGKLIRQDFRINKTSYKHLSNRKRLPHFLNEVDGEIIDLTTKQLQKVWETSKRNNRQIIDDYKRDIILAIYPKIKKRQEILAKIVKKELSQLLQISENELEKYLENKKIQLTN